MWIREEDLKCVREMTIGELLDELAQGNYDDYLRREKLKQALCLILIQARDFFADKNDVCRGALAIAGTAISAEGNGYLYTHVANQLTQYIIMLANEMLGARGAGCLSVETLVDLRKISDADPDVDEYESWPEKEEITVYPAYQPQAVEPPVSESQAAA
jgi:hypothetical protein